MTHALRADRPAAPPARGNIYLEVAAGVTAVRPGRAVLRGSAPSAARAPRCGPCWSSAPRTSRCCATAPRPASRSTSSRSATSSWCAPARRSPPTGSWSTGSSAVDASMLTGESVPVEVGAGRRRHRRHRQRRRAPRRARHPGRRRHPAGADGPAGRGRPERQGRGAAARRPDLRRVRPRRHRASPLATLGVWLACRLGRRGRVHRRRRGAHHRLPVRARAGHADRAAGRHRPRRPARRPDQGPRGAGVHPQRRHDRARQDRHRHHRPDDPRRRDHRPTATTATTLLRWPVRSRTRPSIPIAQAIAKAADAELGALPARRGLRQPRRPRRAGRRRRPRRRRRAREPARRLGANRWTQRSSAAQGSRRERGQDRGRRRLGRPRPRRSWWSPTPSSPPAPKRSGSSSGWA